MAGLSVSLAPINGLTKMKAAALSNWALLFPAVLQPPLSSLRKETLMFLCTHTNIGR